jgi:hypothetical protein
VRVTAYAAVIQVVPRVFEILSRPVEKQDGFFVLSKAQIFADKERE